MMKERVCSVQKLITSWEREVDTITHTESWQALENLTKEVSDVFNKLSTVKNRKGYTIERWLKANNITLGGNFDSISGVGKALFGEMDSALTRGDSSHDINNHLKVVLEEFVAEHFGVALEDPDFPQSDFVQMISKAPSAIKGIVREAQKKYKAFNSVSSKRYLGKTTRTLNMVRSGLQDLLSDYPTAHTTDSSLTSMIIQLSETLLPVIGCAIYSHSPPPQHKELVGESLESKHAPPPPPHTQKEGDYEEAIVCNPEIVEDEDEEGEKGQGEGGRKEGGDPIVGESNPKPPKRTTPLPKRENLIFLHSHEGDSGKTLTFYVSCKNKKGKMLKIPQYFCHREWDDKFIRLSKREVPRGSKADPSTSQPNNTIKKLMDGTYGESSHEPSLVGGVGGEPPHSPAVSE
jgi:hypothetical protein